MKQQISNVSS